MVRTLLLLSLHAWTAAQAPPPAPVFAPPAPAPAPALAPEEPPMEVPVLEGTAVAPAPEPAPPAPTVVEAAPLPPAPAPRPTLPWWGLGVTEKTYRMVLPDGPGQGSLTPAQTRAFWTAYTEMRRESFTLDLAEMAFLTVPALVFLGGALVVPVLSLPGLAQRFGARGSTADNLVSTAFVLTPVVSLCTAAAAGLALLGFTALTTLDAQDNGSPPAPAAASVEGHKAVVTAARGQPRNLWLAVGLIVLTSSMSLVAFAVPFVAPLFLAPLFGVNPRALPSAYLRALGGGSNGALFGWTAVASFAAVALLNAGVPAVVAAGYASQALPGVLGWDEREPSAGDVGGEDRDLSSFLNPADFLFGRRKTTPPPEQPPPDSSGDPELQPAR